VGVVVGDASWTRVLVGKWESGASDYKGPANLRELNALSELILGRHFEY
jgi:hypothetical protein